MNYIVNTLIWLIPIWVLLGYLFARRKIASRSKRYLFFLIVCSYLSYPSFYFIAFEFIDVYLSWQASHCGWGYGLGKPDEYCFYSKAFPEPLYGLGILHFSLFILAILVQLSLAYSLDKYRMKSTDES